ncbi:hypothetical protein DPMN_099447 [Dreissena polymorpha]|uniref:Uncharacterized protein n=1 Tax=Dreissena polymorpha TaxID=45954 RepID=A0A9D4LDX9_DREPO|nr:hypothetical protein DPMN_099447 [Dreissena polymorpha]
MQLPGHKETIRKTVMHLMLDEKLEVGTAVKHVHSSYRQGSYFPATSIGLDINGGKVSKKLCPKS